jgi:hypothetical protein
VEVDLEIGLPEAVKLKVGEWQHLQKLDYEQLPFKCRGCHEYGHFQRNCPKTLHTEKTGEEGWQQPQKGRSKSKGPRRENPTPDQGNPGNIEMTNSFKALGNEGEMTDPSNAAQGEEERGDQILETGGTQKAAEGVEKPISPPRNGADQGTEEGEISSGNESEGASEAWDTQRSQAEVGNPKKWKGIRKPTRTFSKERNQPSSN